MTEVVQQAISAQGLTGCVIDDCGRTLVARGMCRRHYVAWWRCTPKDRRPVARSLKRLTPAQRFARKVKRGGPEDCWPFTGGCDKFGHGQFYVSPQRPQVPAHVFALELATGIVCPDGKEGCHHCDNPPCCNPAHVYYGTRQQNVNDMWSRGRGLYGEKANGSKLTQEQVVAIRVRFAAGEYLTALATEYGGARQHRKSDRERTAVGTHRRANQNPQQAGSTPE